MKRIASVLLAFGLVFAPATSFAVDRVEGTVRRVDTDAFIITVLPNGGGSKEMSFQLTADKLDELELDVNDQVSVEYDATECNGAVGCIPAATLVQRKS